MFFSCLSSAVRRTAMVIMALAVSGAWAQSSTSTPDSSLPNAPQAAPAPAPKRFVMKDYSKSVGYFPNPLAPYLVQPIPPPDLSNTPLIGSLIQNGTLYLSMDDAVALALENNLDIAIARYNLNIADTDIMRTKAGASYLGVNSGVVEGTPGGQVGGLGGTIGSGPGGTTPTAGGAATGVAGVTESTEGLGPAVPSFDPVLTGTAQYDADNLICTSPFCGPLQDTGTLNFGYTQGFHWGTNLNVSFTNSRVVSNSAFTTVSPSLNSGFKAEITQPLLQGFGFLPNTRFIRIAKNNREITDVSFRLQVITTVDQIENMYWNLVYAYEYVRVQQEALAFAQKTLSDTKKQVQIGTLAPIEIVSAQSTVATDQQNLITAQTNLQLQELLMKNALSRTMVDPTLADARVVPTSTMVVPKEEEMQPTEDLINEALSHRAELAELRIDLKNRDISKQAIRNLLRPSLSLFAYYGGSGLGGAQNPDYLCGTPAGASSSICNGNLAVIPSVGYGDTLNQLVNGTAPDKGIGLQLSIPILNRTAQATQIRSGLEYRQAQLRLQQLENQVRIEVRNAEFDLEQNRAAVQSAQAAVDLARQTLDAEEKKLALGASTSTLVLQDQSALATAESNLVSATAAYEKSRVELQRATGMLLDQSGIIMSDAISGEVTHMPTVPDIAPRPPESIPPTQAPAPPATTAQPQ
jgi:outer membrane protein